MSKAKKILLTVTACFTAGLITGILYAPDRGYKTRKKIARIKRKLSLCGNDDAEEYEALEELREALQEQIDKVNKRMAK